MATAAALAIASNALSEAMVGQSAQREAGQVELRFAGPSAAVVAGGSKAPTAVVTTADSVTQCHGSPGPTLLDVKCTILAEKVCVDMPTPPRSDAPAADSVDSANRVSGRPHSVRWGDEAVTEIELLAASNSPGIDALRKQEAAEAPAGEWDSAPQAHDRPVEAQADGARVLSAAAAQSAGLMHLVGSSQQGAAVFAAVTALGSRACHSQGGSPSSSTIASSNPSSALSSAGSLQRASDAADLVAPTSDEDCSHHRSRVFLDREALLQVQAGGLHSSQHQSHSQTPDASSPSALSSGQDVASMASLTHPIRLRHAHIAQILGTEGGSGVCSPRSLRSARNSGSGGSRNSGRGLLRMSSSESDLQSHFSFKVREKVRLQPALMSCMLLLSILL